jgi:hypothetical protein
VKRLGYVRRKFDVSSLRPTLGQPWLDERERGLGELVNSSGKRLVPLNLTSAARERAAFDKLVLNMSPEQVARYWIDRKIRGNSGPPKSIEAADLLQRVVARLDGAIGYAPAGPIHADLKIIRIDGKAPNDSGYPLEL